MSYIALYRKWRPSVFEDVVEQEHVVKTLRYSVGNGRIAHAYLFCGTRGTGKTTMAHILSRAINCLDPQNGDPCNKCEICLEILSGASMDVLEMDAASNNSVDNVREIRDEVVYAPSRAKYKVYIIDEVHMLSTGAFNALLKTLEEPPAHVVFILATTEPHKLPATILSRCQRFDFRRITVESIVGRLMEITAAGGVKLDPDAGRLIARMSDGALRDAISLLDQCISLGKTEITYSDVLTVIGIVNDTFVSDLVNNILDREVSSILSKIEQLVMDGKDIPHFISDLVHYFRNLLICKVTAWPGDVVDLPAEVVDAMKHQCGKITQEEIINIIKELSALEAGLKWATNPRTMLEVTLVKLCENKISDAGSGDILARLEALEKKLSGGFIPSPAPANGKPAAAPLPPPTAAAAKPAAGAGSPKASPAKLSKTEYMPEWEKILEDLKNLGRRAVHAFLLDTKAVRISENIVGIVFNEKNQFGKTMIAKPENMEAVEAAAGRVLGVEVKIKCLDEEGLEHTQQKAPCEVQDELVEKARSIAEKAGIPFEIIDE